MKDIIAKMMKSDYGTKHNILFPRAFPYVAGHNVKMTTSGIALKITKSDNMPVAKF
jgi:hypothetical protein